jgi:hypothetical protein
MSKFHLETLQALRHGQWITDEDFRHLSRFEGPGTPIKLKRLSRFKCWYLRLLPHSWYALRSWAHLRYVLSLEWRILTRQIERDNSHD